MALVFSGPIVMHDSFIFQDAAGFLEGLSLRVPDKILILVWRGKVIPHQVPIDQRAQASVDPFKIVRIEPLVGRVHQTVMDGVQVNAAA